MTPEQIKLLILSSQGKHCILAIHSSGDIFGELCLAGLGTRHETAVAIELKISHEELSEMVRTT